MESNILKTRSIISELLPVIKTEQNINLNVTCELDNTSTNNEDVSKLSQSFERIEYENKYGRLYKTFDAKFIKERIWEALSNVYIINMMLFNWYYF